MTAPQPISSAILAAGCLYGRDYHTSLRFSEGTGPFKENILDEAGSAEEDAECWKNIRI